MSHLRLLSGLLCGIATLMLTGCATSTGYDYSAFRQSRPTSILLLPPINNSPSVEASYSLLSQLTLPLAESGYYVLPVTLVDETFRQNGLNNPAEAASVPVAKLRQIFGADAALYVTIKEYGTVYRLIASESVVSADGRLIDLRTGTLLWEGSARASSADNQSAASGGLAGLLVAALVNQIVESTANVSHRVAATTSYRLVAAGRPAGILYGPRSPYYQKQ